MISSVNGVSEFVGMLNFLVTNLSHRGLGGLPSFAWIRKGVVVVLTSNSKSASSKPKGGSTKCS